MARTRNTIWVNIPPQQQKTKLQKRVERVVEKAAKNGYSFNQIELDVFHALGQAEWNEKKVSWIVIEQFDRIYYRFFKR